MKFMNVVRKYGARVGVGVGGMGLSALALADGAASFSANVTPQITASQSDIVTIGGAVLILLVVVAAIGWVSRAFKK